MICPCNFFLQSVRAHHNNIRFINKYISHSAEKKDTFSIAAVSFSDKYLLKLNSTEY